VDGRPALVLYDADCGICTRFADGLQRRGVGIAPIRSATGDIELRDLPHATRDAAVHAIDARGRRLSGAAALPLILRTLPRLAWAATLVELLPVPSRLGYATVARNRRGLSRMLGLRACSPGRTD
jgi:predicted DCC family thiol-disulfide oxidoreductase YuxK